MGKKRSVQVKGKASKGNAGKTGSVLSRVPKKKFGEGIVHIESTFNNTKILLTDKKGDVAFSCSPSMLGFSGKRKTTPFAASEAAKTLSEVANAIGVRSIDVIVKGAGSGRENALRTIASFGFTITSIKDKTPVPHNGVRRRKPKRN